MTLWLVAGLVLLVAAGAAVCWWGAGLVLHPPAMSPLWIFPEQFGLRYERVSFATRDGVTLKGWFLPSPSGDTRTLIMCHGWGDNKGLLLKQTYFLNEHGYNLLYFDFRSHGESEGRITTIGPLERRDFDAAVEWLRREKPRLAERVGAFGLSMGAAVVVSSLPDHPDLRCAVVESPFSDYRGVVRRWAWNHLRIPAFPLIQVTLWMLRWRVGDPQIDSFKPVESARRIARPILMIAGERDDLMPEDDVRLVYAAAASEPKQLWVVPDAWHAKCFEAGGLEYETRVKSFYARHL